MWNRFIEFYHLANFHEMARYFWNADSHYLKHLFETFSSIFFFFRIVFSDVYCQLQMNVLYDLVLQDSYSLCGTSVTSYFPITGGSFIARSFNVGSSLRSNILVKKSVTRLFFFHILYVRWWNYITKWKHFTCDAFSPSGIHRTKMLMLARLQMRTNDVGWEF